MSFSRNEYPRSRKARVCEECDAPIAVGEKYARLTWYEPEIPGVCSVGVCLRCWAMRSVAWEVFDWEIEDAPSYGDLRTTLTEEWHVGDPEAWLDAILAADDKSRRWRRWSFDAVAAYQAGLAA